MIILANPRSDWNVLRPLLFESIGQTLTMVLVTLVIGGFLGLILGVVLYGTRPGNLFENAVVYRILDIIVNIVRPIPFIIFLAAMQPLTIVVVGTSFGTVAAIFPMVVMCTFATSRLVEQNLVPVDPGVIEAARSMGAGKLTIIRTVLIPEANKPDLYEVDEEVKKAVKFIPVSDLSQVLKHALILPAASAAHKRTMPQATQLIAQMDPGYHMDAILRVKNCLYAHYTGPMPESQLASYKLQVHAFENEQKLTGTSYTIYVNQDEDDAVVDVFMETK